MIKELRDLNAELRLMHEIRWGGFNDYPPGWAPMTEGELAQSRFFSATPVLVEYRQMFKRGQDGLRDHKQGYVDAHLHFMSDCTGYAVRADYWGKKVQYFRFGCQHEWGGDATEDLKGRHLFRTEHAMKCKKCGYFQIVDSSD